MKKAIFCSTLLLGVIFTGCQPDDEPTPDLNIDLAAYQFNFSVEKTAPFQGTATITGMIRNLGDDYRSSPGKQTITLYEKAQGETSGKIVAQKEFTNLDAGETLELSYSRSWSASVEFPPGYILWISYGPDITRDGNEANDDSNSANNKKVISGAIINGLF